MELLIVLLALVGLAVASLLWGYDSRDGHDAMRAAGLLRNWRVDPAAGHAVVMPPAPDAGVPAWWAAEQARRRSSPEPLPAPAPVRRPGLAPISGLRSRLALALVQLARRLDADAVARC